MFRNRKGQKGSCYRATKKRLELDLYDQIKLKAMLKLGLNFDNIETMSPVRWILLYKTILETEGEQVKVLVDVLKQILGLELKQGVFTPLSMLINPELVDRIMRTEAYVPEDGQYLSENEVISIIEELDKNAHS